MSAATLQLAWRPLCSTRAIVLITLFSVTAVLLASIGVPVDTSPRWPTDITADGWSVGPESLDSSRPGVATVTRVLTHPSGARASYIITTSPNAKTVFRAGAAVPYLGNGYSVEPAQAVPGSGYREAFIARRAANEAWLQISIYGERRGQFGSGVLGWSLATLDSLLGRANDYYLARIVMPYDDAHPELARAALGLADILFPQAGEFYGT